jgi:hypothetical protein
MKRAIKLGNGWYPASSNPQNRLDTPARVAGAVLQFRELSQRSGRDPATLHLAHVVLWPVTEAPKAALSGGRRTMTGPVTDQLADVRTLEAAGIQDLCLSFHAPTVAGIIERMERFAAGVLTRA